MSNLLNSLFNRLESFQRACIYGMLFFVGISSAALEIFTFLALIFLIADVVRSNKSDYIKYIRHEIRNHPFLFYSIFGWLLIIVVSICLSDFRQNGFDALFGKILPVIIIFFVIIRQFHHSKFVYLAIIWLMAGASLVILSGISQYIFGIDFLRGSLINNGRVSSSLRAPTDFGVFLVVVLPFFYANFSRLWSGFSLCDAKAGSHLTTILWVVRLIFIGGIFCLGVTYSRGAWLAAMIVIFLLHMHNRKHLILMLIGAALFMGFFSFKMLGERAHMSPAVIFSTFGRLDYWKEAISIIREYPIFGAGLNSYSKIARDYKVVWGGYPHNSYLHMMAEIGILGITAFGCILVNLGFKVLKRLSKACNSCGDIQMVLAIGMIALLFQSAFDTFFYSTQMWTFLWLGLGLIYKLNNLTDQVKVDR